MNRIGLKDYLLNEASDSDLLDCAKAYDTANQYGHFDTQDSVEEAAKLCGWDVETALSRRAATLSRMPTATASTDMGTSRPSATRACSKMPATTSTISSIGSRVPADMTLRVSASMSSCSSMRKTRSRSSTPSIASYEAPAILSRSI